MKLVKTTLEGGKLIGEYCLCKGESSCRPKDKVRRPLLTTYGTR